MMMSCLSINLLLRVISLFLIFNPTVLADQNPSFDKGLLWVISHPAQKNSYLFGTMHSANPLITNMPDIVVKILKQSTSLTLELTFDLDTQLAAVNAMMLPKDKNLAVLLGENDFKRLFNELKQNGITVSSLMNFKPWAAMILLLAPKDHQGAVLDQILEKQATAQNKKIYALETVEEQLSVFDEFNLEEQITMLRSTLNDMSEVNDMLQKIQEFYLDRDIAGMWLYNETYLKKGTEKEQILMQRLMNKLLNERNPRMLKRMQNRLIEGNAFIAIGALHLPGKIGLLNLLTQQGYTLKPLY
jgi:uncharacterized protein YbaP (TraB family)